MLYKLRKYIYPRKIISDFIPNNSNILDLGCGKGDIINELKNKNFKFYKGIDPKVKFNILKKNIQIIKSDVEGIIDEILYFDCILMIDVMHHIKKKDQDYLIKKIIYQLKKGGIFIYKDISNRNKFFSLMNRLHDLIYNFEIINYYNLNNITKSQKLTKFIEYNRFYHRQFWYDHEFLIIKKIN